MRRYAEPVEVRVAWPPGPDHVDRSEPLEGAEGGGAPASAGFAAVLPQSFVWRGRHYRVRAVTARWRERRAWWREALDPPPGVPHGIAAAARERLVWRVEAVAGHSRSAGVFDLACDEPDLHALAGGAGPPGGWQLLRVAD